MAPAITITPNLLICLTSQIKKVLEMAGSAKGPAVGALTSENRDVWADVCTYELYIQFLMQSDRLGTRSFTCGVSQ